MIFYIFMSIIGFSMIPQIVLFILTTKKQHIEEKTETPFVVKYPVQLYSLLFAVGIVVTVCGIAIFYQVEFNEVGKFSWYHYLIWFMVTWIYVGYGYKGYKFNVVVNDKGFNFVTLCGKTKSVLYSEICSAERQVKYNNVLSERMVIKTAKGKVVVENRAFNYSNFLEHIVENVSRDKLKGF